MTFEQLAAWSPPPGWVTVTSIDAHAGGEPLRVIVAGFPPPEGDTILARRRHVKEHHDRLRTALMWEPRGHREMYGCILTPAVTPGADLGVLFTHNEGYSTMCGHGIIAVTKVVLETGLVAKTEPESILRIDTPAGLVTARARISGGRVRSVAFRNVPSYVVGLNQAVDVPGLGTVRYDLAFGGAFYAYVRAESVGLSCAGGEYPALIERGMAIKRAVMASQPIPHPFEPDLGFLYGTIFIAPPVGPGADSRNVCVFANGEIDRSPTGTGVSGRMAIHYERGEVGIGDPIVIESIVGSRFTGRVVETTSFGGRAAVIPEVEGEAYITGIHRFVIDPDDPLGDGFMLY